jgi:hypothetical protein
MSVRNILYHMLGIRGYRLMKKPYADEWIQKRTKEQANIP